MTSVGSFTYAVWGVGPGGEASEQVRCDVAVTELPAIEDLACDVRLEANGRIYKVNVAWLTGEASVERLED